VAALEDEFQFYLDHQSEIVAQYNGRVVVIVDHEVQGAYSGETEAFDDASARFAAGTFLIQRVSAGDAEHSQTFYSRVAF
jgi:hypothetical protein